MNILENIVTMVGWFIVIVAAVELVCSLFRSEE